MRKTSWQHCFIVGARWSLIGVLVACTPLDAARDSGASDAGGAEDAAPVDAAPVDAAPVDAALVDAGLVDAGEDAGSVDAGCPGGEVPSTYYADSDGDGFGDPAVSMTACASPSGYVTDDTDCLDSNRDVYPGSTTREIPGDGIDSDCRAPFDACSDFDCDNRPDLVSFGSNVYTYSNTGSGFALRDTVAVQGAGTTNRVNGPTTGLAGDLDADGYLDLVTFFYNDSNYCRHNILWGGPSGYSIDRATTLRNGVGTEWESGTLEAQIIDVNGDGNLDLVLASYWTSPGVGVGGRETHAAVYYGDGRRGFVATDFPAHATYVAAAEDINGDGNVDLVFAEFGPDLVLRVYWGRAAPAGPDPTSTPTRLALDGSTNDVDLVDLDGDGDLDLITTSYNPPSHVFLYDRDSSSPPRDAFSVGTRLDLDAGGTYPNVVARDLDGDGCHELVFANSRGNARMFDGVPSGGSCTWSNASYVEFASRSVRHVVLEDLDGDGYLDAAMTGASGTDVYFGSSAGLATTRPIALSAVGTTLAHADFEGDGVLDLVVSVDGAAPRVFWGRPGTPTYAASRYVDLDNPIRMGAQSLTGARLHPIQD